MNSDQKLTATKTFYISILQYTVFQALAFVRDLVAYSFVLPGFVVPHNVVIK